MNSSSNPYEPIADIDGEADSIQSESTESISVLWRIGWAVVYFYPVLTLLSVYACWAIVWMTLGHRPKPMIDDPKYIGGFVDVAYGLSMLMWMFLTPAIFVGICACFWSPTKAHHAGNSREALRWAMSAGLLGTYISICAGCFYLLRFDPGNVVEWYLD